MLLLLSTGLGLVFGSFIAALTWRWPRGESIVRGRSRCDHCATPLGWRDLVPVLSHTVNRGRCRHCGAPIARRHLAIELGGGLVGAVAALAAAPALLPLALVLGWWLLALLVLDVEHLWLPDRLTLPLGVAGIATGLLTEPAMPARATGAALGFALLAAIAAWYRWRRGRDGLGGGDPKLLAAIGAWTGPAAVPVVMTAAALLGLILVAAARMTGRRVGSGDPLPLGALLAACAWPIWLALPWLATRGWLP